ncbi:MAG: hypothetical protein RL308_2676 [Bacteroidota bacterium]|jgi:hypothetical protein
MGLKEKHFSELEVILLGGSYGAFNFEVIRHFNIFNTFLEDSEIILKMRKLELSKKHQNEIDKLDWTDIGYQSGELYELQKEFELRHISIYDVLFNSTFLGSFGLFESSLRILFWKLNQIDPKEYTTHKSIKWGITELQTQFKKQLNIDFDVCDIWAKILDYKEIRNSITHRNGGICLNTNDLLLDNLTYKSVISIGNNIQFNENELQLKILNKNFISDFIFVVFTFYKELENSNQLNFPN